MADDEKTEGQQKTADATNALDSIEAKHVAGGGAADISDEVSTLRGYVGEAGKIIDAKAAEDKKAQAEKDKKAEARAEAKQNS